MKLTVLGSGIGIPTKHRSASAYLLEATGVHFLIDAGPGTLRRLVEYDYHLGGINHVLLTHVHPDHVFDVVPLLSAKFGWEYYAKLMKTDSPMNEYPIDLVGPPGFEKVIRTMADLTDPSILSGQRVPVFAVQFTEVSTTTLQRGNGVTIQTVQTEQGEGYIPPSVAFLITEAGKKVLFTGDLRRVEEVIALGKNAGGVDVLVIDCHFSTDMQPSGHLNPPLVAQAAGDMGARKVVLTHLADFIVEQEDPVKAVKSAFRGDVILAHDGLKLEI